MSLIARNLYRRTYEAWNHRLRTFAGGRFAERCRPTSICFLITERCNARCVHCDIWKNRGKEDSPSPEEWKRALDDLRGWLGTVHVVLTGGEALLMPYTPEVVEHGSKIGLMMEVLTHGYWRDQSRVERLAMARPWRVTLSLDGLGDTHSRIRGRDGFFDWTSGTIDNLKALRDTHELPYSIRLKCVVMRQNLDQLVPLAEFATQEGMDVFFQPIEQNYNTPEDPEWYLSSENWPEDPSEAVRQVEALLRLKGEGRHVANSEAQLRAMVQYFGDPAAWRVSTQSHAAHEQRMACAALQSIQVQSNGDVRVCASAPPVGNIKESGLRAIWNERPDWWNRGCCMERRLTDAERRRIESERLVHIDPGPYGAAVSDSSRVL